MKNKKVSIFEKFDKMDLIMNLNLMVNNIFAFKRTPYPLMRNILMSKFRRTSLMSYGKAIVNTKPKHYQKILRRIDNLLLKNEIEFAELVEQSLKFEGYYEDKSNKLGKE